MDCGIFPVSNIPYHYPGLRDLANLSTVNEMERGPGSGAYTRFNLQKLSILFKELTVPKSTDLLRYFPAEITEEVK